MKKIYLISALAAVLCGFLVFKYVGSVNTELDRLKEAQKPETMTVVTAAEDIPPFTEITEEMLVLTQFPKAYAHEFAAQSKADVLGRLSNGTIVKGEVILTNNIGSLSEITSNLSGDVPDGKRAMTISVSIDSGVGGYITKGDFVDVIAYISSDTDAFIQTGDGRMKVPASVTKVIVQNAEVLRTGDRLYSEEEALYTSLTLALSPLECEKVFAASQTGSLYAVLRQTNDSSVEAKANHGINELIGK